MLSLFFLLPRNHFSASPLRLVKKATMAVAVEEEGFSSNLSVSPCLAPAESPRLVISTTMFGGNWRRQYLISKMLKRRFWTLFHNFFLLKSKQKKAWSIVISFIGASVNKSTGCCTNYIYTGRELMWNSQLIISCRLFKKFQVLNCIHWRLHVLLH